MDTRKLFLDMKRRKEDKNTILIFGLEKKLLRVYIEKNPGANGWEGTIRERQAKSVFEKGGYVLIPNRIHEKVAATMGEMR